ncbi:MAG: ferrous iron transport protein B, partial [Oscillospiraceae bacterium]
MALKIALAGNPNSGKTTLFNFLTGSGEYVGNRAGVTVEPKKKLSEKYGAVITDLPGVYSLSPYTAEEVAARKSLFDDPPDVIIDVIDSMNIERSLNLAIQLSDTGIPLVLALNMTDILDRSGGSINADKLTEITGLSAVFICAFKGLGADELIRAAYSAKSVCVRPFCGEIESCLSQIGNITGISSRFELIKLFERDEYTLKSLSLPKTKSEKVNEIICGCERLFGDDSESLIISQRFEYIEKTVLSCVKKPPKKAGFSEKADKVVLNRFFCLPLMLAVLTAVYSLAYAGPVKRFSEYLGERIFGEALPAAVSLFMKSQGVDGRIISLVTDGIIGGVGSVLSFLPQLAVLFFSLALLEECGYMSRVAFSLDYIFRRLGFSGKSAVSFLVATGCGAMGVMASRTVEHSSQRRLTAATACFMPCSAKIPIVVLIAANYFDGAWWVAPFAYMLGMTAIAVTGLAARLVKKQSFSDAQFIMELPPYHIPKLSCVMHQTLDRALAFVKKAGTVIFLGSTVIWFFSNFDFSLRLALPDNSMLAFFGRIAASFFAPLGFGDWKSVCAVCAGFVAKENIVSTLEILGGSFSVSGAAAFLVFN